MKSRKKPLKVEPNEGETEETLTRKRRRVFAEKKQSVESKKKEKTFGKKTISISDTGEPATSNPISVEKSQVVPDTDSKEKRKSRKRKQPISDQQPPEINNSESGCEESSEPLTQTKSVNSSKGKGKRSKRKEKIKGRKQYNR